MNDPWEFIKSLGIRHYHWDDPFYADGNKRCHVMEKVPCVDLEDESVLYDERYDIMACNVPGCKEVFSTVAEHAAHQHNCHTYMCVTCRSSFPSHHLLDLHILEMHDSFFFVLAQKKPMYQCLLETCKEVFNDPKERKTHCMKEHMFPSDFRYDLSWRKKGKQKRPDISMDCDEIEAGISDMTINDNPENYRSPFVKKPKVVPAKLSFGSGIPRGFQRQQRGKGIRGKNRRLRNHLSSAEPSTTSEGKIDMSDVQTALMRDAAEGSESIADD